MGRGACFFVKLLTCGQQVDVRARVDEVKEAIGAYAA
jgi:hypothetical protein